MAELLADASARLAAGRRQAAEAAASPALLAARNETRRSRVREVAALLARQAHDEPARDGGDGDGGGSAAGGPGASTRAKRGSRSGGQHGVRLTAEMRPDAQVLLSTLVTHSQLPYTQSGA